jgi:hypothetical protein
LAVALAATLVTAVVARSSSLAAQQPGGDAERVRELVARLLGRGGFTPDGRPITTEILVGELPADPPAPLPVPPNGRVVGSVVQRAEGEIIAVTAALDAPGPAEAVAAFYERELSGRGYRPLPSGPSPQGGFQATGQATFRTFCGPSPTGFFGILVTAPPQGPAQVRINVDALAEGPCSFPGPFGAGMGAPSLPALSAPAGVVIRFTGPVIFGGPPMLGNRVVSEATAITEMPVAALEAAFAEQLAAGWMRLAGDADTTLAWSRWRVPDEEGRVGFLYVLTGPGTNERTLHLDAETPAGQRR